ncbi:hypothetical protein SAMN05421780_104263 [Flexibacter flexilis DSM 6793]|uniref:Uncharacterized protein n=1 Tax=Flexibacter flexilis DSM 6793 TaxID=927664 RepID=A0A1I1I8Q0_9BACT|nr:hypothetical protein [Flexibacter flexilis]SFC32544.1 hypothetical protein SAMN05421780_104263 [Flexibacter flexilis DSM 6793]
MIVSQFENKICKDKNVLVVLNKNEENNTELLYLIDNFCGTVKNNFSEIQKENNGIKIYICGDFSVVENVEIAFYIIQEVSTNYENLLNEKVQLVSLGEVPIIVSSSGVYFRNLFSEKKYFNKIKSEHEFQKLTESNKESKAFRTGIYITEILREIENDTEILSFHLLRCSSNFTGSTDNFRTTDHFIINKLNESVKYTFEKEIKFNHVLAQIYENTKKSKESTREIKAKIKAHSDKTKDMPKEGLMAFCTFYDRTEFTDLSPSKNDKFDLCYKEITGLTKLHFKLKNTVKDERLEKEFSVILYPNSAFIIPLSTNRLYTHEIRPSILNVERIPVRMGYVVRCSNVEAKYINNQTFIIENGNLIKLEPMTLNAIENLRASYIEENKTENIVEYGKVHFSMNLGDYEKPIY